MKYKKGDRVKVITEEYIKETFKFMNDKYYGQCYMNDYFECFNVTDLVMCGEIVTIGYECEHFYEVEGYTEGEFLLQDHMIEGKVD